MDNYHDNARSQQRAARLPRDRVLPDRTFACCIARPSVIETPIGPLRSLWHFFGFLLLPSPRASLTPFRPSSPHSNSSKAEKMSAAVTAGTAAALANPLVAEAAMTPSLKNTLLSVVAGGIVLAAIAAAVVGVSTFDKVSRK